MTLRWRLFPKYVTLIIALNGAFGTRQHCIAPARGVV